MHCVSLKVKKRGKSNIKYNRPLPLSWLKTGHPSPHTTSVAFRATLFRPYISIQHENMVPSLKSIFRRPRARTGMTNSTASVDWSQSSANDLADHLDKVGSDILSMIRARSYKQDAGTVINGETLDDHSKRSFSADKLWAPVATEISERMSMGGSHTNRNLHDEYEAVSEEGYHDGRPIVFYCRLMAQSE